MPQKPRQANFLIWEATSKLLNCNQLVHEAGGARLVLLVPITIVGT